VTSEPAPDLREALPVATVRQIDALCLRYEADWKAGRGPQVTDYLEGLEGAARALLLEELRALERAYLHGGTLSLGSGPERQTPVRAAEETAPSAEAAWRGVLGPAQQPGELGRLGPYPVLRLLGAGGMGLAFEAVDPQLRRRVALKVMKPALAASPQARHRFAREARATAAVVHDNIVTIHHVGEERGLPFLVMQLLEGETLQARLEREGRLPAAEVVRVGRQVAEGLAAAHARGLIHRDIKPANLWLEAGSGRVKILDFGLARLDEPEEGAEGGPPTREGDVLGTPGYMSPEQLAGLPLDARSDLFSLGCVLYRLAVGSPPFEGVGLLGSESAAEPVPPHERNPDIPPPLSRVILWLLARQSARRPASATQVVAALRSLEAGGEVPAACGPAEAPAGPSPLAGSAPAPRPARPWWRSWQAVSAAAVLAAGSIAAAVVLVFFPPWKAAENGSPGTAGLPAKQGDQPKQPAPLAGSLDVWVTEPGNPRRQGLMLHQPWALPLQAGMRMKIVAEVNRPAYLYLVYLDSRGEATPLFPWKKSDWKQRPAEERRLRLVQEGPLDESPSGIESLLLLVREERLPDNVDLAALFKAAGLPKQKRLPDRQARAWFENGELVRGDAARGPVRIGDGDEQDDPVMRTQALLRAPLRPLFPYTRAVCFAFQGE
jgi:hypothetical protein